MNSTVERTEASARLVDTNGITLNVMDAGRGPALLLLHGWPHTSELWRPLLPWLAQRFRVIAPDLRGIGGSTKATSGYDVQSLSVDLAGLLDALGIDAVAASVGIDAGVAPAWMLGMIFPNRVERFVLMEGLLGSLPGAEAFLSRGAPWWFGFHSIPAFAEQFVAGHEGTYLDFFLCSGTQSGKGISPDARDAFVSAYSQPEAMRCGFEYYRAMPENARQIAAIAASRRTSQPTLAIAGGVVGAALHGQLAPLCDNLRSEMIPDCAHIIPQEQPAALAALIADFAG